ncbi:MAG: hypothetical protein ACI3YD_01335 [Alloprevotella sp.]
MKQNCYTPELLQKKLQTLHARLDENKASIAEQWHTLFAPPAESGSKLQHWMNQADRAIAVYDGVMLGYKLLRRFNGTINRWTHKNRRRR